MSEQSEGAKGAALPTLADVLALPDVRVGRPEVVAAEQATSNPVRWVHVSELADIAGLLQGGELILTTGIALPQDDKELRGYAQALAEAGAAGLVVELGRRFSVAPPALVRACSRHRLPLVLLHREVRFVKVTEAVHSLVVEEQVKALRASEQAHEIFTALSVSGAGPDEIVRELTRAAQCPVVYENLMHQVLSHDAHGLPTDALLRDWESRSRAARSTGRVSVCGPEGWMVTPVESRGETCGRLVMLPAGEPTAIQRMLLQRGATALILNRMLERSRETLERQSHGSVLTDLIEQRFGSDSAMNARAAALGVTLQRRVLVAVVVDLPTGPGRRGPTPSPEDQAELVAAAARQARLAALAAVLPDGRVGALLSLATDADLPKGLARFADEVRRGARKAGRGTPVVAVGSVVQELDDVRRSFAEAEQVADAALGSPGDKEFYQLPDIQLRGLLTLLADDPRLQSFVERTLGAVLEHDSRKGTHLLDALRLYLSHGGNKSAAADAAHLSRQSFYQRLAALRQVLGVDLDDAETRTSLHAAVMALESRRAGPGEQ